MKSKISKELQLTQRQYEILNGSLLGDGCLSKIYYRKQQSCLRECHSLKQKGWLEWKQKELLSLLPKISDKMVTARKNLGNNVIVNDYSRQYGLTSLQTCSHSILTNLEQFWYKRNSDGSYFFDKNGRRIKQVPLDLILTPLTIAVWFMDDGHNNQAHRNCHISTEAFSIDEVDRLFEQLKNLGIISNCYCNKGKPIIRIPSSSYDSFLALVKKELPDLPECMKYKFDTSMIVELKEQQNAKQRNAYQNMTNECRNRINAKRRNISNEQRDHINAKQRNAYQNMPNELRERRNAKSKETYKNMTNELRERKNAKARETYKNKKLKLNTKNA